MAVRRESVRLDVEGNFARGVLEDAAAVEVLKRSLKDLSGTSVQTSRSQDDLGRGIDDVGKSTERTTRQTKQYGLEQAIADERAKRLTKSLRDQAKAAVDAEQGIKRAEKETKNLNLLWTSIGTAFPAVVPLAGVGAVGLAGIANDAGAAALSVGSLVIAMHGVAPALKAVNKAALEPTAANLQAAREAMAQLSPEAQKFVREFQGIEPILHQIQGAAASGWFPGLTRAMHNLIPLAPVIEKILHDVGRVGGDLAAQGAKALAGPEWRSFFKFIDTEMPKAMEALGHVVGSLAHGLGQLWMAFAPLNTSFNDWLVRSAHSFDQWATGLSRTQGFQEFLDYLHQNGPKVGVALEAIANAAIAIVHAAAPLGGPTLDAIAGIANAIGKIADSPLGTPLLAMLQMVSMARLAGAAVDGLAGAFGRLTVAEEEAAAASGVSKGGFLAGLRGKVGIAGAVLTAGQIASGNSGDAAAQNNYNAAAAQQNLAQMKAALADMESHLAERNSFNSFSLSGLGSAFSHPLDFVNSAGSDLFGEGRSGLEAKIAAAKQQIEEFKRSQRGIKGTSVQVRAANHETADSFVNLAQAMQKPTLSLDHLVSRWKYQAAAEAQLGKNIAVAIQKGANPEALQKIIDQLGPAAGLAIKQLANGGKQDIASLNKAFGSGQKAAKVYNGALNDLSTAISRLPKNATTRVQVTGADAAMAQMRHLRELISGNPITQSIVVKRVGQDPRHNVSVGSSSFPSTYLGTGGGKKVKADGGTIPHDGRPYADRYLYMLAPGEEVISNRHGQADRNRALLKAINANRAADGGTVGRRYSAGGMSGTVRHVIEVKVTGGELDLHSAKQQIHAIAREVSRDEIDQQAAFDDRMGR